jgi:hypothetical protein
VKTLLLKVDLLFLVQVFLHFKCYVFRINKKKNYLKNKYLSGEIKKLKIHMNEIKKQGNTKFIM